MDNIVICNTVSDWLDCDSDCMGVWDWLAQSSSKPLVCLVHLQVWPELGLLGAALCVALGSIGAALGVTRFSYGDRLIALLRGCVT